MTGDAIASRLAQVTQRIAAAAERAGRDPKDVTLVAVSKTHPFAAIAEAAAAGALDFGENYVQELVAKQAEPGASALRWHFIGHLQRNKAKYLAGKVALVHAVDSLELARELDKRAVAPQPVLVAVNLAGEATKSGTTAEAAAALCAGLVGLARVQLVGLMTMPPPVDDPQQVRPVFRALAELRLRLEQTLGCALPYLSMGMSGDYEVAIAEGATHVRVGTAIFGARD